LLKTEERGAVGAIIGIVAVLFLAFFPAGATQQVFAQFGFINTLMVSLAVVAVFAFAMAWFWPKIRVGHMSLLILAFLAIGIFLGFPAFTALGLVGLVFTTYWFWGSRAAVKRP
jgi:hypothetical protein